MTGINPINRDWFYLNLRKARHMAEMAQVNSIVITGKTEPLLDMPAVEKVCRVFEDFPIEIQTNGILLNENVLNSLAFYKVSVIAVSMDNIKQFNDLKDIFKFIKSKGMTVRLTVNLVNELLLSKKFSSFSKYLAYCKENGVEQLSFREITIPNYSIDSEESKVTQRWIKKNVSEVETNKFISRYEKQLKSKGMHLYDLAFGASLYMLEGVSCTYFEYCVQDSHKEEDIRSLIYYEDGHMSSTWYGSNYGRIF